VLLGVKGSLQLDIPERLSNAESIRASKTPVVPARVRCCWPRRGSWPRPWAEPAEPRKAGTDDDRRGDRCRDRRQ
jgi:hypothetical protein